ncbi:MAG TPA: dihydrolipoamide acetyltransferase family protein, partial [Acidimicrobiia bacterium]|nr:dihydrolipoamide acetyltransferase family protein [Acidimicrobiia bacterium]
SWFAKEGDEVKEHQPLLEVQTDKALVELPAPVTGILVSHGAPVGGVVKLGGLVATFESDSAAEPAVAAPAAAAPTATVAAATVAPAAIAASAAIVAPPAAGEQDGPAAPPAPLPGARPLAAPTVRQLARDLGIDLASLSGSGPGGRIVREDVEQAASGVPAARTATADAPVLPPVSAPAEAARPVAPEAADSTRIPLRGLRRTIARRMTETLRTVPHVSGLLDVDVTDLAELLKELRPTAEAEGVRLTWTAFFALATIQALKEFPQLNASLDDEREEIILHRKIHLGIATATDDGLLVPVVRDAHERSLLDLAAEIGRVSEAARNRTATMAELTGSTFTLTNYGAVGGWYGTPMVNAPEIGIVGFGSVAPRPWVVDGELAVRTMVALSHTVDHRLIDGAVNASFGSSIRRRLEQPQLLLLGVRHGHG